MLGFLRAKLDDALSAYSRFNDKETAEGVVAIMIGTSYADGEVEPAERAFLVRACDALGISPSQVGL